MLVFTAYTHDTITVMDLNNPQRNCSHIDLGPLALTSSPQSIHASYVGNNLMACSELSQECYQYDDVLEDWTDMADRMSNRFMPYALDLDENRNWISGGSGVNTSEIYDGEFFNWSVDLPVDPYVYDHCAVYLGGNDVMVMGGT